MVDSTARPAPLPAHIHLTVLTSPELDQAAQVICSNNVILDPATYNAMPVVEALVQQGEHLGVYLKERCAIADLPCLGLPDGGIPLVKGLKRVLTYLNDATLGLKLYTHAYGRPGNTHNLISHQATSDTDAAEQVARQRLMETATGAGGLIICDDHIKNGTQSKQVLEMFHHAEFPIYFLTNFVRLDALQMEAEAAEEQGGPIETLGYFLAQRPVLARRTQIIAAAAYSGLYPPFIKRYHDMDGVEEHDLGDLVRAYITYYQTYPHATDRLGLAGEMDRHRRYRQRLGLLRRLPGDP
jgi:hypothetical protein